MSKILTIEEMLEAAAASGLPGQAQHAARLEAAAQRLADALARHLHIRAGDATYEPGFGGLAAAFYPERDGQPCPPVIHAGDPSGDWEPETVPPEDWRHEVANGDTRLGYAEWWAAAWAMYAENRPLWRARVRRMKARAERAAERVAGLLSEREAARAGASGQAGDDDDDDADDDDDDAAAFYRGMFLRARCGCLHRDCPLHGAWAVEDIDRLIAAGLLTEREASK